MSEYDENGFDKDWIHIVTGTRYDEYGFNKDRSIHRDTGLPTDKNGKDYGSSAKVTSNYNYFDKLIESIFFLNNDLSFLKKINNFINKGPSTVLPLNIKLNTYKLLNESIYNGPRCLDGTPDLRYSRGYSTKYSTYIEIIIKRTSIAPTSFETTLSGVYGSDKIEAIIDRYNTYLFAMNDKHIKKLYSILENINHEYKKNTIYLSKLSIDKKEKINIYNKLKQHKDKFTEEQNNKFINLLQDIKNIENKIGEVDDHKEEFDEVYQRLKMGLNELSSKLKEVEIDDLFKQLK